MQADYRSTGQRPNGLGDTEDRREIIERALSYPYERPSGSYVFVASGDLPLETYLTQRGVSFSELISGRTSVLAIASNASPEQLKRKSDKYGLRGDIPVLRAVLHDFDVVYSAHIVRYGSVPATLQRSEGTMVSVFVMFLDPDQLEAMHNTGAGNYDFIRLRGVSVALEAGETIEEIYSFQSRRGCLEVEGKCVSLVEVSAEGRKFPAMAQREAQEWVKNLLGARKTVSEFIFENIGGTGIRQARNQQLQKCACAFGWEKYEVCDRLGG